MKTVTGSPMTIKSFVSRYHVTIRNRWDDNPDEGDWSPGSSHWRCTLRCRGRQMTIAFHQGPAISQEPTAEDVLGCIHADDPCGETFEDWCRNFGYNPDSRKAEKTYRACQDETAKARRWLGDLYPEFLQCTEE